MVIDTSDLTVDEIVAAVLAHLDRPPDGPGEAVVTPEIIRPRGPRVGRGDEPRQRIWYRFMRGVVIGVARTYFRASVIGAEHIPTTGPFILSPIHRSNLDTPFVALVTPRRLRYMGKESLWKGKFGAWFFTGGGGFPVKRGTADREALGPARRCSSGVSPWCCSPRGPASSGPMTQGFFDGAAFLACRPGRPSCPSGWAAPRRPCARARRWSTR